MRQPMWAGVAALLAVGLCAHASAQDPPVAAADSAPPPPVVPVDAAPPQPDPFPLSPPMAEREPDEPAVSDEASSEPPVEEFVEVAPSFTPGMGFNVFSDTNVAFGDFGAPGVDNPYFAVGGVDFFATAELSAEVRALSESVLEILPDGVVFDLERVYLEWTPLRAVSFRLGRDHLMLGRYMQTYHHAMLFQLTTSRPLLLSFEDEGGPLPAHQIGLEMFGDVEIEGALTLHYVLAVGNGRGQFADDVLSTFDRNASKAVLGQLSVLPSAIEGLEAGVSAYIDRIPSGFIDDMNTLLIPRPINEQIYAAHAIFNAYPWDIHAEGYHVRHKARGSDRTTTLTGGFVQLGYSIDRFTPYARMEHMKRSEDDAFLTASGAPNKLIDLRVGLRYSLADQAVLKFEYEGDLNANNHGGRVQAAFGL